MGNKILYKTVGRKTSPIVSVDADDKNGKDVLAATKQEHIAQALRSGSQMPTFEVVETKNDGDKAVEVSRRVF